MNDALELLYDRRWNNYINLEARSPIRAIFAFKSEWNNSDTVIRRLAKFYRGRFGDSAHVLCMQVRPPRVLRFPGSPRNRLGDFDWPRFPQLIDIICVAEPGWTYSQASIFNDNQVFPGYDPYILISEHGGGGALGFASAILAELLGRSDERSAANYRRRRLQGATTKWFLGERPKGMKKSRTIKFLTPPLWKRPFLDERGRPIWGSDWPMKYGEPRSSFQLSCGWPHGCREEVNGEREARRADWTGLNFPTTPPIRVWFCEKHTKMLDNNPTPLTFSFAQILNQLRFAQSRFYEIGSFKPIM